MTGDKLQQDIRSWLSPPDPSINHKIACELRHTGTTAWFIQGDAFSEWKCSKSSSLLWVHGKRSLSLAFSVIVETDDFRLVAGAGKSILWHVDLLDFFFLRAYCVS